MWYAVKFYDSIEFVYSDDPEFVYDAVYILGTLYGIHCYAVPIDSTTAEILNMGASKPSIVDIMADAVIREFPIREIAA